MDTHNLTTFFCFFVCLRIILTTKLTVLGGNTLYCPSVETTSSSVATLALVPVESIIY